MSNLVQPTAEKLRESEKSPKPVLDESALNMWHTLKQTQGASGGGGGGTGTPAAMGSTGPRVSQISGKTVS